MTEISIPERLRQAQTKVKTLTASRESIIGDVAREEQKLTQAYSNLRQLGVEDPEGKTVKELKALEAESKAQLEEKLGAIETQLATGEELMKKYNELQEN